ncbi:histidinol-phosphatase [Oricola cellulosilytica]|uniref:Histidinol-phosphatase n=1 Tax=Oricola cellulosilytica TaxID=1429082 RepID=A0A4R0P7E1_9HYPH|nr:histidinol-phosphatase [Oricola cellulosilytica]TCD11409.1 histidinol-phosphatase [Oricola cellulosilytica]
MSAPLLPEIAFFQELAEVAAAETLPLFRSAASVENKLDTGFDPVTQADCLAEDAMRSLIEARFPDHGIIGEERGTVRGESRYVWIIDPIDGTRAYISGLPVWGTLAGLRVDGAARAGMMSQPFTNELFVADGRRSLLIAHGRAPVEMTTRGNRTIEKATLFTTSPALYNDDKRAAYDRLESRVRLPRYGCDCYAFAMLAAGHADLVVEPGLQTYDIAALIPLIEQAGGVVTTWEGANAVDGGDIVAAATPDLHAAALEVLNAKTA